MNCRFLKIIQDFSLSFFSEYVARHVGLVHRKLDEMMCNEDLIKTKAKEFSTTNNLPGPAVKIEPVRKSQRQATKHVSKDFIWTHTKKSVKREGSKSPKEVIKKEVLPKEEIELKPMVIDEICEDKQGKEGSSQ